MADEHKQPDTSETVSQPDLAALMQQLETLLAAVDRLQNEIMTLKTEIHPEDEKSVHHE